MTSEKTQKIFSAVNEKVQTLIKPNRFYIALYDPKRSRIEFPWVVENGDSKPVWETRTLDESQLPDHVLSQGSLLHYERDVITQIKASTLKYWPSGKTPNSWLGVPVVFEGKVFGAMIAESFTPGAFDQRAASLLATIANQAATAIENTRLYERLDRRIKNLDAVYGFGQKINSAITLGESKILQLIYEQSTLLMDTQNMYIALYDHFTDMVRFPLMFVDGKEKKVPARKAGSGRTEYIVANKKTLFIQTREESVAWYKQPGREEYIDDPFASWIGVPMISGDQVIGVIAAFHKTQDFVYDEQDLLVLKSIASQAVIALENAQLLEKEKNRTNQLEALQKNLEEKIAELEHLQGEIADKERALVLTTTTADFVHRVNNLAGTIPNWAKLAKKRLQMDDKVDDRVLMYLEKISNEAKFLLREARGINLPLPLPENLNLESLIGSILGQMEVIASPEITFILKNEMGPVTVHAIRQQLSDSIFNIIDNGTKAITGEGQLSIMILMDPEYPTKNVRINISDTGRGIPPDKQSKIFELGISYNTGGTGYGLWRSKNIVEGLGGNLDLVSSSPKGTTFSIILPISTQPAAEEKI